jgi:hypothetical protein
MGPPEIARERTGLTFFPQVSYLLDANRVVRSLTTVLVMGIFHPSGA